MYSWKQLPLTKLIKVYNFGFDFYKYRKLSNT